jgi:hypothetical protein
MSHRISRHSPRPCKRLRLLDKTPRKYSPPVSVEMSIENRTHNLSGRGRTRSNLDTPASLGQGAARSPRAGVAYAVADLAAS